MISKFRCESYSQSTRSKAAESCSVCIAADLKCGRQRPRCDNCTKANIVCPGYAQKLTWLNASTKKSAKSRQNSETASRTKAARNSTTKKETVQLKVKVERSESSESADSNESSVSVASLATSVESASLNMTSNGNNDDNNGENDGVNDEYISHENAYSYSTDAYSTDVYSTDAYSTDVYSTDAYGKNSMANSTANITAKRTDINSVIKVEPVDSAAENAVSISFLNENQPHNKLRRDSVTSMVSEESLYELPLRNNSTSSRKDSTGSTSFISSDAIISQIVSGSQTVAKSLSLVPRNYLPFVQLFGNRGTKLFLSMGDIPTNPFESILRSAIFLNLSVYHSNDCLMNGIAAVSSWQMEYQSGDVCKALEYKSKAIKGLGKLVSDISTSANLDLLLCAAQSIVILTSLDEFISSKQNWKVHFTGMKNVLENMANVEVWHTSLKATAAWLGWCDIAIAFTSREMPVIPIRLFIQCIEHVSLENDGWDLFALTGLGEELVMLLVELIPLAHAYKVFKVLTPEQKAHLDTIVNDLPLKFKELDATTPDDPNDSEYGRICDSNVWLTGITLYCYSIFGDLLPLPYENYQQDLVKIMLTWARKPTPSNPCCKQMAMPLFIASEYITDDHDRKWVRQFHDNWAKWLSMEFFNDCMRLVERVWSSGKHWYEIIDEEQLDGEQLLLG